MFSRSFTAKDRVGKITKPPKRSFGKENAAKLAQRLDGKLSEKALLPIATAIITVVVGKDERLFAAHEDVLSRSPYFKDACRDLFFSSDSAQRLDLRDEDPQIFSALLEFLYKGDYYPRLLHDKRRDVWYLEDQEGAASIATPREKNIDGTLSTAGSGALMHHSGVGDVILKDTAIYCAAHKYGLEDLKRLALRKQGLQSGIEVGTILRSMRYAYEHTPETDSRLRAHYLALIVRSRRTFKRSGTMQMEMARGGSMFFDLFVAMCNHLDDISCNTPRTV